MQIIKGLKSLDLSTIIKRSDADLQLSKYVDNKSVRQFLLRNLAYEDGLFSFKCNLNFISECYPQIMLGLETNTPYSGPTLFIKGGESDYLNMEHKEVIDSLLPKSKVKIIQGAGHWLHAEKTTAFNKIVKDFFNH